MLPFILLGLAAFGGGTSALLIKHKKEAKNILISNCRKF
jgi:hypothetical protein